MDATIKKRLFLTVIFATLAEVSIFLFIFIYNTFTIATWRIIIGSFTIITGITFMYNMFYLPIFDEKNKILKYSLITQPSITMIFAGIAVLFWDQKRFFALFLVATLGAVISFLIGFVLQFYFFLIKKE